jgi:hypothetical protein
VGKKERLYQQSDRSDQNTYRGAEEYGGDGRAARVATGPDGRDRQGDAGNDENHRRHKADKGLEGEVVF